MVVRSEYQEWLLKRCDVQDAGYETPCWLWHLTTYEGYAFSGSRCKWRKYPEIKANRVHRQAYLALVGPIGAGLVLDHLCKIRHCCNPAHLEPVTNAVNIARGYEGIAPRSHCKRGHPLSGNNLYVHPRGTHVCRTCQNASKDKCRRAWRGSVSASRAVPRFVEPPHEINHTVEVQAQS